MQLFIQVLIYVHIIDKRGPDSKVHVANVETQWGGQDPVGLYSIISPSEFSS